MFCVLRFSLPFFSFSDYVSCGLCPRGPTRVRLGHLTSPRDGRVSSPAAGVSLVRHEGPDGGRLGQGPLALHEGGWPRVPRATTPHNTHIKLLTPSSEICYEANLNP